MDAIWQSASVTGILELAVVALIAYAICRWVLRQQPKNLPPGPRGLRAMFEMIQAIRKNTLIELAAEWAERYGPIIYLSFMGKQIVFLNTPELTRRVMTADEYKLIVANRTPNSSAKISFVDGTDWVFLPYNSIMRKKRRMYHAVVSIYGDGVEKFESIVSDEMNILMEELERHENQDFQLGKFLARSLKHIVCILVVGERPKDVKTTDVLEEFDIAFNKIWAPEYDFALDRFPILAKIPCRFKTAVDRLKIATEKARELIYVSPKRSWIPGQPRGVADHVFDFQKKPGYEFLEKDPEQAAGFLMSLFGAAHLTSRGTLLSVFLCLVNYPAVQRKIHEEIDRVIGDRAPKLEHKSNMPYTDAAILEILRLTTPIPFGGLRTSSDDIHIDGMTIPKNTLVLINTGYFHHNERVWEDPWTFKPERYLDEAGELLPADHPIRKNLLPFGIGNRGCPGEVFARSRVFMFITSILQKYHILPPTNEKLISADFRSNHDDVRGFIRQVQPYKCRLRRREKIQNFR
ncbi:hypothetical protein BsWGS_10326 [Bradybaena similaris]